MSTPRAKRRSADQWQIIIESYRESNLSPPEFCEAQKVNYTSFMKWNRRLCGDVTRQKKEVPFMELTPPSLLSSPWLIELDLAPGVQLRIARSQ